KSPEKRQNALVSALAAIRSIDPTTKKIISNEHLKIYYGDAIKDSLALWRQAYEALKKQYPNQPPIKPPPVPPKTENGDATPIGKKNDALYPGTPARVWLKQLQDVSQKFRCEAVEALGNLAISNAELIPVIVDLLQDKDSSVAITAESAIRSIGPKSLPVL